MKDSSATVPSVNWSGYSSKVTLSSTSSTSGSAITVSASGTFGSTSLIASAGGVTSSTLNIYLYRLYLNGTYSNGYTSSTNPGSTFKKCGGTFTATKYYLIPNTYFTLNGSTYYAVNYGTHKGSLSGCSGCGLSSHNYWYY